MSMCFMTCWEFAPFCSIEVEDPFGRFVLKRCILYLEPQTTICKWLFQLDDSQSLHRKWLFHQTSIYKWLFGVPGIHEESTHSLLKLRLPPAKFFFWGVGPFFFHGFLPTALNEFVQEKPFWEIPEFIKQFSQNGSQLLFNFGKYQNLSKFYQNLFKNSLQKCQGFAMIFPLELCTPKSTKGWNFGSFGETWGMVFLTI